MRLHNIPQHWRNRIAADPDSEFAKKALAIQKRIDQENARHGIATEIGGSFGVKSNVGTILEGLFKRVGGVPCSECKRYIIALNKKSVPEIRSEFREHVLAIEANAQTARKSLWASLLMYADQKFNNGAATKFTIALWLKEACDTDERNNKAKARLLARDSGSDSVDRVQT